MDDEDILEEEEKSEVKKVESTYRPMLWLVTFTDTIMLMVTFMAMLLSMAYPRVSSLMNIMVKPGSQISFTDYSTANTSGTFNIDLNKDVDIVDLIYLAHVLHDMSNKYYEFNDLVINLRGDVLIISFNNKMLFERGKAVLTEESKLPLNELAIILSNIGNKIVVAGHTDTTRYVGADYSSNWDFSIARANVVAKFLKDRGYQYSIDVMGYGKSKYQSVSATAKGEQLASLARRVDILIYKSD